MTPDGEFWDDTVRKKWSPLYSIRIRGIVVTGGFGTGNGVMYSLVHL
jgi:hypothetical protein